MEDNQPGNTAVKDKLKEDRDRKRFRLLIILILLLFVSNIVLVWMLMNTKQEVVYITKVKEQMSSEKDALDLELKEMLVQYDSLEANNEQYKAEIEQKRNEIIALMQEAEKHKDDAFIIAKLKKEAATLRTIMKGYIHTIDSLNTLNVALREENTEVKHELDAQKGKVTELEKVKEGLASKVKIGQRLKAKSVVCYAQMVKSNDNHKETTKAKKTDKIKTCFTLERNDIAVPGSKPIYIRIISPSASILPCGEGNCEFAYGGGSKSEYSLRRDVEYDNNDKELCIYYDVLSELKEGTYIVEIFCEDYDIGRVNLVLK